MDSDIGKSYDRISKLPESLLCHILSFLPAKYSVGTSILSTRWRYLWTSVPNLDFDEFKLFQEYSELSKDRQIEVDMGFQNFVNRVLLLSDVPCFQKFHLKIGSLKSLYLVDTSFCAAIKRNVQDLELENLFEINVMLPHMLFTSITLVALTLFGALLDVPDSIWLPSLKILNLNSVAYGDEDSLQKLLSGCPVLEELHIERWLLDEQQVMNVSVPTLKHLTVVCFRDPFKDELDDLDESDDEGCKLVVDAPQLERLDLIDYVSKDILFRNLSSLSKASIFVGPPDLTPNSFRDDGLRMYKLLGGIPNVKFLDACLPFQTDVSDYKLPTFRKLTQLEFGADGDDSWNLKLLADILQCSRNLEVLILKGMVHLPSAESWSPPQQVPNCLLLNLEEIEIKEFRGKTVRLNFEAIGYLLKHAVVLKTMTIDCQAPVMKDDVCGELSRFPRGCRASQLNLFF